MSFAYAMSPSEVVTYLRLSRRKAGLLLNFKVKLLKDGSTRRVV